MHLKFFHSQCRVASLITGGMLAAALAVPGCSNSGPDDVVVVQEEPTPVMEARPAGVGVGAQGSQIRADDSVASNLITGPAKALFNTKEKVVFEIQIPSQMKLFEAMEGRRPENQDEFMEKIVAPLQIQLPRLPEGMQYVYHAEDKENPLWVEPIETATP